MPDDEQEQEPTQPTQPAKGEPIQIPVPKRDDVLANLRNSQGIVALIAELSR